MFDSRMAIFFTAVLPHVPGLPCRGGEHVPGLGPPRPGGGPLGLLPEPVFAQRRDRCGVQRDHPPPGAGHQPAAGLLQLTGHRQRPGTEV